MLPSLEGTVLRDTYLRNRTVIDVAFLCGVLVFFLNFSWVGFLGSDDAFYLRGAQGVLSDFPFLGSDHWQLRYPIVVPIAVSIGALGIGEFTLALPSILYLAALVIATYLFFRTRLGASWSLLLGSLIAAAPIFSLKFTTAAVESPEVFFTATSLLAFVKSTEQTKPMGWLILSGVLAAVAFASRETALSLVLAYLVLFAIGYGRNRLFYFVVGGSFAATIAVEYLYLWIVSGDPLYRLHTDVGHDLVDRQSVVVEGMDAAGNLSVGGIIDPFLVIFANQEFGLLFIIGAFALCTWRLVLRATPDVQRLASPFIVLAICNFLLVSALSRNLYLEPRYFTVAAYAILVVTVIWLRALAQHKRAIVYGVATLLVSSLIAGSLVDNKDYFFAERALVNLAIETEEVIYTDPSTAHRAEFLLTSRGVSNKVKGEIPTSGALYFYVAKNLVQRRQAKKWFDASDFQPRSDWQVVETVEPPKRLVGQVAAALRLETFLPKTIARKLLRPNQSAQLFRAGEADAKPHDLPEIDSKA